MYYLAVIQHPEGTFERLPVPLADRDFATRWLLYKKQMDPAGDTWLLYHKDPLQLEHAYVKLIAPHLEEKRLQLEQGTPGDHDSPYLPTLPIEGTVQRDWAHLMARVGAGEMGGEFDGITSISSVRIG